MKTGWHTARDAIDELRELIDRFPREGYPVQHATAQFHLGTALLAADRAEEAVAALGTAVALFRPEQLPAEHAKATNMLGVALRARGDTAAAEQAFVRSLELFTALDLPLEEAAARYNLGLVRRVSGDLHGAVACFEAALETFAGNGAAGKASAAGRELGGCLLELGDVARAVDQLQVAVDQADRSGDLVARGAAANVLGLAHLARDDGDSALQVLEESVACNPRAVRPQDYAMAKANLAVAAESVGRRAHATLAARQALGTPGVPASVADQARTTLEHLGDDPDALHVALDLEPLERWAGLLRDELVRWLDASEGERRRCVRAWIDGIVARGADAEERSASWMGVLLELPPRDMEQLVRDTLRELSIRDADACETFVDATERVMIRFGLPQFLRVKELFNQLSDELGYDRSWG